MDEERHPIIYFILHQPASFGGEGVVMRPLAEFDHRREIGLLASDAGVLEHPLLERLAVIPAQAGISGG